MKAIISGCLFALGFMIVLGAAGGSDLGTMEFGKIVTTGLIGLGVMWIGSLGLRDADYQG